MKNANLKILATAYDEHGEFVRFVIGLGKKTIGDIVRNGRFFEARIGPATHKGLEPGHAAQMAWEAFCDWQPAQSQSYGMFRPISEVTDQDRVTAKTLKKDKNGEPIEMAVFVADKEVGTVTRQRDGRFLAVIDDVRRKGLDPMAVSRLAWIEKQKH